MVEELKSAPRFRRYQQGDTSIFEDIVELQEHILQELEVKHSFFKRFDKTTSQTIKG